MFMNGKQIAYDLFESDELRTLFIRSISTSVGCYAHDVIGIYGMIHTLALVLSWESASIALGGTHSISHALQRAFSSMGGKFFVHHEVDKVLVENDTAVGVRLADGSELRATQMVVSDLGIPQTMFRLLGEEYLTDKQAHRVRNIDYDRLGAWWGNFAIHELPDYIAKAYNPDAGMQPRLYLCAKDPDYAQYYSSEVMVNGWGDRPYLMTGPDSIWDPDPGAGGQAHHRGRGLLAAAALLHREGVAHQEAGVRQGGPREVAHLRAQHDRGQLHRRVHHLPVRRHQPAPRHEGGQLGAGIDVRGPTRPLPSDAGVLELPHSGQEPLHLLSANLHSASGIGRGSSYAAYKVIAEDHGLTKFWEGRAY